MAEFLHYIPDSTEKQLTDASDERLRRLHEVIESIRSNSEMEAAYMKAETREREIIAEAKEEGYRQGQEAGQKIGRREGKAEAIIDLLEDLGDIPGELTRKIREETDEQIIIGWIKAAAKAESIEEFMDKII